MIVLVDQASVSAPSTPPASASSPSIIQSDPPTEVGGVVITAPKLFKEPAWAKTLDFDLRKEFAPADEPYLRQRPTDSCKLMAGGATSVTGKSGAAAGLVCAKRF